MGEHRMRLTDAEIKLLIKVLEAYLPPRTRHHKLDMSEEEVALRVLLFRLKRMKPGRPGTYVEWYRAR